MKLCVAQTRPVKGAIQRNLDQHRTLITRAVSLGADLILFPELSLTGYEPTLAEELATQPDDPQLAVFQTLSDRHLITIAVGMPTRSATGVYISLLVFQPHQPQRTYSKRYLHADEEPYFVPGSEPVFLFERPTKLALAICYELSVPEHAEHAFQHGADLYVVSVAKTAAGVEKAAERLAEIAKSYSMTVLMANSVGPSDDFISAGQSAVWNDQGVRLGSLDDQHEGLLVYDTDTQSVLAETR